jgi:hypothetical protein
VGNGENTGEVANLSNEIDVKQKQMEILEPARSSIV